MVEVINWAIIYKILHANTQTVYCEIKLSNAMLLKTNGKQVCCAYFGHIFNLELLHTSTEMLGMSQNEEYRATQEERLLSIPA